MIKLMFCLHRRADLTREAFQAYWYDHHAPLVREVAPVLGIRRYVQSHAFADPRLAASADARGGSEGYDGVAELCWDDVDSLVAAGAGADAREAGRRLLEDERRFIDLARSPLFWVNERTVI